MAPIIRARCFNSQPPEGGWFGDYDKAGFHKAFQLTAARRRLARVDVAKDFFNGVSTHSRPKAAGLRLHGGRHLPHVSTHSRPKAAGKSFGDCLPTAYPRFNSQPPEGGWPPPIV